MARSKARSHVIVRAIGGVVLSLFRNIVFRVSLR